MQTTSTAIALRSLMRADFTTQWRNRRSFVLILIIPVIILFSFKSAVLSGALPASFALGNCITVGLMAIGLMGYTNTIARDRDKRIFQRLRVAPLPTWSIMASRLTVQIAMILALNIIVLITGANMLHATYSPLSYLLVIVSALAGGAVYLGLGQAIVGLIKNPESVNSTTRLVYFVFIMVGMFGESGILGDKMKNLVGWTPYGTVTKIVSASLNPGTWNMDATNALLATLGYAIIFTAVGIRNFQWDSGR
jgi:ABC-2 type transport system permease protein